MDFGVRVGEFIRLTRSKPACDGRALAEVAHLVVHSPEKAGVDSSTYSRQPPQPALSTHFRNVRFMAAPSEPVLFASAAGVCATEGPASA